LETGVETFFCGVLAPEEALGGEAFFAVGFCGVAGVDFPFTEVLFAGGVLALRGGGVGRDFFAVTEAFGFGRALGAEDFWGEGWAAFLDFWPLGAAAATFALFRPAGLEDAPLAAGAFPKRGALIFFVAFFWAAELFTGRLAPAFFEGKVLEVLDGIPEKS
jgi:hypothetical protein